MVRHSSGSAPHGANGGHDLSGEGAASGPNSNQILEQMPTIRLIPHQDPRASRPSLTFPPCQRTLPHEDCIIRVGRYSERDSMPNPPANIPSSAPIGFKSKVVSRRHCEFWCSQGQWYIKDVKSSSGTFLNHIRLSQPSSESRPWPVNDGDVVQLGIDFRGGEEMIFRCVKIRIECNRAWQKTLNSFNVEIHKRLRDLGRSMPKKDSDVTSAHSSECSICLMCIAPCQSLFVAPCSHVWHYRCIRPILNDHKTWPHFLCPNCRAITDLEAEIDDPIQDWPDEDAEESDADVGTETGGGTLREGRESILHHQDVALASSAVQILSLRNESNMTPAMSASSDSASLSYTSLPDLSNRRAPRHVPQFSPVQDDPMISTAVQYLRPITPTAPLIEDGDLSGSSMRTPTSIADQLIVEGPMTPTNHAGPFVFDGSAGQLDSRGPLVGHIGTSDHVSATADSFIASQ